MTKRNSQELALGTRKRASLERYAVASSHASGAPLPWRQSAAHATWIGLLAADLTSWVVCVLLFDLSVGGDPGFWVAGGLWFASRAIAGLYDPVLLGPPEELRLSIVTTFSAVVAHVATAPLFAPATFSVATILSVWSMLLLMPWALRHGVSRFLSFCSLYGSPVVIIGAGGTATDLIDELRKNPHQALQPIGVFDDDPALAGTKLLGVPVLGSIDDAVDFKFGYDVEHALVALDPEDSERLRSLGDRLAARFAHIHMTPEFVGLANLWVRARPIGSLVTLEFRHDRVRPFTLLVKRVFDATLGLVFLLFAIPLIALCGLLVKLVSAGPAFFTQVREGHRGRLIRVWKIRTMVPDAEDRLQEHLSENTVARREWAERAKLEADPRVIPGLGAFLRRWSLDELPQLWNVVTGSMSLVGPRPFPGYHLDRFPEQFRDLRRHVPPGVTGLWQVTHRTDGDLSHQQAADSYYVHNWSIWLDLWILLRTVGVVLSGSGV